MAQYCTGYQADWQPWIGFEPFVQPVQGRGPSKVEYVTEGQDSIWLMVPDDEWTVAYRLVPHGGALVVGELRIYPTDPPGGYAVDGPGRWSQLPEEVPSGGLAVRHVRRIVRINDHKEQTPQILLEAKKRYGDKAFERLLLQRQIPTDVIERIKIDRSSSANAQQLQAAVAAAYVTADQAGEKKPVVTVALQFNLPRDRTRDIIRNARRNKLLTKPPKGGVAGGHLTDKCRQILGIQQTKEEEE